MNAMRGLCSNVVWKYVDGPATLVNNNSPFMETARARFATAAGVQWVKKNGGAKYKGKVVCGWHIMNCALRKVEKRASEDASSDGGGGKRARAE